MENPALSFLINLIIQLAKNLDSGKEPVQLRPVSQGQQIKSTHRIPRMLITFVRLLRLKSFLLGLILLIDFSLSAPVASALIAFAALELINLGMIRVIMEFPPQGPGLRRQAACLICRQTFHQKSSARRHVFEYELPRLVLWNWKLWKVQFPAFLALVSLYPPSTENFTLFF